MKRMKQGLSLLLVLCLLLSMLSMTAFAEETVPNESTETVDVSESIEGTDSESVSDDDEDTSFVSNTEAEDSETASASDEETEVEDDKSEVSDVASSEDIELASDDDDEDDTTDASDADETADTDTEDSSDESDSTTTEENVSVSLYLGESYTVTGSEVGTNYDSDIISVSEDIAPKDHTSNTASSLDSFSDDVSTSTALSQAEFTLTETDTDSVYTVYNEYADVYLTNASAASTLRICLTSTFLKFTYCP